MAGDCGTSLGTARSKFGMGWVTLVVFGIGVAWGCSCGPQRPICELFGDARTVFRGTVVDYHDGADGTLAAYLVRVEEPFKGLAAGQAEVFVDAGFMAPCPRTYQVGMEYVFVSHGPGNVMMASVRPTRYPGKWRGRERIPILMSAMCDGSGEVAGAGADLEWLRGKKESRVYGRVVQTEPGWRFRDEGTALAGARVTLRDGAMEWVASSQEDGAFSFEGIPAGVYVLTASRYGWRTVVEDGVGVAAGGCAYRALFARTGGGDGRDCAAARWGAGAGCHGGTIAGGGQGAHVVGSDGRRGAFCLGGRAGGRVCPWGEFAEPDVGGGAVAGAVFSRR